MGGGKDTKILSRFPSVILRLAGKLPLPLLHALGTVLGWAIYGISPTYRRSLRANLEQAGYTDAHVRREAIAAAGKMLAELPALWFRPHAEVAALVREVNGVDQALAAHAQGKPLLLLTPHMGCFEVTSQYAALHMPITVLYRPPRLAWPVESSPTLVMLPSTLKFTLPVGATELVSAVATVAVKVIGSP